MSTPEYRTRVFAERDTLRRAMADGRSHQRRVLADLLEANAGTKFGTAHGFDRVGSLDDFRAAVPIQDYASLAPWIEEMAAGAHGVLTAEDPVVYFTSSGSTGAHKKIPVTARFMRTSFFPFFYAAWAPLVEAVTRPDATLNLKHDPRPAIATTASGRPHAGASQVDFGALFGEPLAAEPGTTAPWASLPPSVAAGSHLEKSYVRLRLAVEGDVRCVVGINPAVVAALPYELDLWWPRLVEEVHNGTVCGVSSGGPNPSRARELDRLAERFAPLRPAQIWPNLRAIFCWPTGLASLYLPRLREEYGIGVRVLPAPVAASEGPVGVTLDRHRTAGSLVVNAAVYEFVDADSDVGPSSPTCEPHELEAGREYHVVFSHVGGLYRYAVGDVVRVVDMARGVPRVEYAGRSHRSDVRGERLRESQVIRALATALDAGGLEVRNAACEVRTPAGGPPSYAFAVAPLSPWTGQETVTVATRLDEALGRESAGYRRARAAGLLAPLRLSTVDPDAFRLDWRRRVAGGVRPAQAKDTLFRPLAGLLPEVDRA